MKANKQALGSLTFYCLVTAAILVFSSCGMINRHAAKTYNSFVSAAPYDVVIVPGLPYDTGKINPLLKARMMWAKSLYEKGIARHIIFSGSAVHSPYVEAMVMKIMADSMGIPSERTFIEDQALHSTENVDYGLLLAQKLGFEKVAIATDPFQGLFLKKYTTEKYGQIALLPFVLDSMGVYVKAKVPSVDPSAAYVHNFVPLSKRDVISGM